MKRRLLPFILAGALTAAFAAPAAADNHLPACEISEIDNSRGGAAALAALIAAAVDADVNVGVCTINVEVLNRSLNNLLRNADIDVLNNALNNLLRGADINVEVIDGDINVLSSGFTIVFV